MLQRNMAEEIRERRQNEYRSQNRKVKELGKESNIRGHEAFGKKLSDKLRENKLFWKDVNREKGSVGGEYMSEERGDGVLVSSERKMKTGGNPAFVQGEVKEEVRKAIARLVWYKLHAKIE